MAQQNKKKINSSKSYLPSFSIDNAEKYDLYSGKNAKYLFYKFNDWAESMKGEKLLIRHAAKTKDDFSLGTIEGRNRQFIIEKLIHSMEFKDHYQNLTKKARNRRVYQPLFSDITETFFEYTFSQS